MKKILIILADYYTGISNGLFEDSKIKIKKFFSVKIIKGSWCI